MPYRSEETKTTENGKQVETIHTPIIVEQPNANAPTTSNLIKVILIVAAVFGLLYLLNTATKPQEINTNTAQAIYPPYQPITKQRALSPVPTTPRTQITLVF